jgi:lysophospholipid acyltransferase (LPLAT)-like uncharacterized protein
VTGPPIREGVKFDAAGLGGQAVLGALFRTVRFERQGAEHFQPHQAGAGCIFTLWHGRLLAPAYLHRNEDLATLVSRSADGEYLTRLLLRWNYVAVRGSSSAGGMASVRELVRHARGGRSLVITPDGPRGPRQAMKDGPLYLARLSGLPIIPVSAVASRAWWIEGWDRFMVPQPFSTVRVRYAPPFHVARDADGAEIARRGKALEAVLNRLTEELDRDG